MIYKINEVKNELVEKAYKEAMLDFNDFFGINWVDDTPNVVVLSNRKEIDAFYGCKTESFVVAFGKPGNLRNIYLLDNEKIEQESSHKKYSDEEYSRLVKHEICHLFYMSISKSNFRPVWLTEGVSIYLSGQLAENKPVKKFSDFIEFYACGGGGVYKEAGEAVKLLVENYGKDKLLNLIAQSKEIRSKEDFDKLFKEIYAFDLDYNNFNNLLMK